MPNFLFILPTPHAGGKLLLESLNTSKNISTILPNKPGDVRQYVFPTGEGEYLIMDKEYQKNRFNPEMKIPFDSYKRSMDQYWDYDKKVLCDKSIAYVQRAKSIENYFSKHGEVFFILLIRNPNHSKIKENDANWDVFAEEQKYNKHNLKNVLLIKYEEMVKNPEKICQNIKSFCPDLGEFKMCERMTDKFIDEKIQDQSPINTEMSQYFEYTAKTKIIKRNAANPSETKEETETEPQKPKPKPKTRIKRRTAIPTNKKYLFILCPPFSGSTVLYKTIASNPNVSTFLGNKDAIEGQGQGFLIKEVPEYNDNRHNTNYDFPVEKMKEIYDKHWNMSNPILCDRSPPYTHFAKKIEEHFEQFGEVYFIIMIRNPYSTTWVPSVDWAVIAKEQKYNIENLKNVIHFTYEEFVRDTDIINQKIQNFLPELSDGFDLDVGQIDLFDKNDKRCKRITNEYADRIIDKDKKNLILKDNKEIMNYFGYKYVD